MGIIAKTLTKGFRTCYFRNQPVHQFYGHLQAVLKDIEPSGAMDNLFAKPASPGNSGGIGQEVEWSTDLPGTAVSFKDLSPKQQQEVAGLLSTYIDRIRKYSDSKQGKSGIEKDYAEYLKAVAMSPDLNQVFAVNNKPVLVHWGFMCEGDNHPGQGIYAGWDEFIAQVQRKAEKQPDPVIEAKPAPKPIPVVVPAKPAPEKKPEPVVEKKPEQAAAAAAVFAEPPPEKKAKEVAPAKKEKPPVEKKKKEKKVLACGLGDYKWVKWLAILLAIIILLLLLLRLLPPKNPLGGMGMPPGMSGGAGMPSLSDLMGGGGSLPGLGGNGSGGNKGGGKGKGSCPQCGHVEGGKESGGSSQPADQGKGQQGSNSSQEKTTDQPKTSQSQSSDSSTSPNQGQSQPAPDSAESEPAAAESVPKTPAPGGN